MPANNIKIFDENKVNMLTDVDYNTNAQRLNGVQSGVASSQLQNKTLYQTSLISYAIAQFMNEMGFDSSDSVAVSTFVNNLSSSIKKPADSDVKYVSQTLNDAQMTQARSNIGAANLDTQNKVLATSVPSRTVTLTAAELQGYLNALPKMLTENITLNVTGTLDVLVIDRFYGSGSLTIDGGQAFTLSNSNIALYVSNCRIGVAFYNMTILSTTAGGGFGAGDTCYLASNSRIDFIRCTIQGGGYNTGVRLRGVCVTYLQNCTLTGNYIALDSTDGSTATVIDAVCSENTIGGRVYNGGILLLAGTTPELLGGTSNEKRGGIIAKADGTLI